MIEPSALQKYAIFGGLLEDQIENLIPLMIQEEYNCDDIIIEEGKPNDKIYFIINGQISISKREKLLAKFS